MTETRAKAGPLHPSYRKGDAGMRQFLNKF